jgi:hypothetical protein
MNSERSFLHDISSPLTTTQLNLGNLASILGDRKPEDIDECLKLVETCMAQVKRVTEMVRLRREELIKESGTK